MLRNLFKAKTSAPRKRLLPVGAKEFSIWANRIIDAADLYHIPREDQMYALGRTLLKLAPDTAMETDEYFIFTLRKMAVNSVAFAICKRFCPESSETEAPMSVPPPKDVTFH